ncbi:hypothetical protein SAMN04515674_102122 [Pseudarcicella hirudinis]|uniref:Alpha/beta hydrolase n=1 Tax=Pseudarcicella hirudinis TaxID=1079859 RepID=A0A1I5NUD4_9BACT|nr:hypothetical protein [Pseudarcicella hirudinis]SFP25395.1 hypothetical protein SAMN04515674_102122 [Pseudarcicella hirudinis]
MKHLYIFSGLGADRRVFKYLDLSGYEITFIDWISPEKNEPIEYYAKRLTAQIKDSNPILTGLSFGEIMAIKVAKLINIEKIKRNTILLQDCRNNQPKEHLSKP